VYGRLIVSDTVVARHGHGGFARGDASLELDSRLSDLAARGFSGTVLVAQGDSVVLDKGYGLADRERSIRATRATRYSTAGMTKMFTAVAILTLADEGKLSVQDSLGRWFDDLPADMARVTIHQLLTHSDGLTRLSAPVYRADPYDFIDAVAVTPRAFPSGSSYRYNDFGHSILGLIVELETGEEYEAYIARRFLSPAGMTHTSFEPDGESTATEYSGQADALSPIGPRAYTWGRRGSLGLVSTSGDLFRWSRALRDPTVVPAAVWQGMQRTYGRADWGADIGYGWDRMRTIHGVLWRRVAGTPGMEGELLYDPVRDWTAIILVNTRLGWRFKVWDRITHQMATDVPG
jgi:CubicO group peptidase (beta-lactamase class C family)